MDSNEQKVKARWPDAFMQEDIKVFGGGLCYALWNHDGEDQAVVGRGDTEAEAWADAASRIESEGNPTMQEWAANGGPRDPKRENHAQAVSAAPAESKPQSAPEPCEFCGESSPHRHERPGVGSPIAAPEPEWKAEADRLAEALKAIERVITETYPGDVEPDEEHVEEYQAVWKATMNSRSALASYAAKGGER